MNPDIYSSDDYDFSELRPFFDSVFVSPRLADVYARLRDAPFTNLPHLSLIFGGFYDYVVAHNIVEHVAMTNARCAYVYYLCAKYYMSPPAQQSAYDVILDRANAYTKRANTANTVTAINDLMHDDCVDEFLLVRDLPPEDLGANRITLETVLKIKHLLSVVHFFRFVQRVVYRFTCDTDTGEINAQRDFCIRMRLFHAHTQPVLAMCAPYLRDMYATDAYMDNETTTPNMFADLYIVYMTQPMYATALCGWDTDACAFFPRDVAAIERDIHRETDVMEDVAALMEWGRAIRGFNPAGLVAADVWREFCELHARMCDAVPAKIHDRAHAFGQILHEFIRPRIGESVYWAHDTDDAYYTDHGMFYPQVEDFNVDGGEGDAEVPDMYDDGYDAFFEHMEEEINRHRHDTWYDRHV